MESRLLPLPPDHWLRVHWALATCGIASAIGALCGLLKGLSLANTGGSVDRPMSNLVDRVLDGSTGVVAGEVLACYVLAGSAGGLAFISMPLATYMVLRFRRTLYATRMQTQQRLNQEMAAIVEQTRRDASKQT